MVQRVDLLGDLHRAICAVYADRNGRDDDRRQQRRQLRSIASATRSTTKMFAPKRCSWSAPGRRSPCPSERQESGDRQRVDAGALHVVGGSPATGSAGGARWSAAGRWRFRRRRPDTAPCRRGRPRHARPNARGRPAPSPPGLGRELARRDQLQQGPVFGAQAPDADRASALFQVTDGPVEQPRARRVERRHGRPVDDDLAAVGQDSASRCRSSSAMPWTVHAPSQRRFDPRRVVRRCASNDPVSQGSRQSSAASGRGAWRIGRRPGTPTRQALPSGRC